MRLRLRLRGLSWKGKNEGRWPEIGAIMRFEY